MIGSNAKVCIFRRIEMHWECECGVVNKNNSEKCQGCGFTREQSKNLLEEFTSPEKTAARNKQFVNEGITQLKKFLYVYLFLFLVSIAIGMFQVTSILLIFIVVIGFIITLWGCTINICKLAGVLGRNKVWWFLATICFQPISVIISFIRINGLIKQYIEVAPIEKNP